MPTSRFHTMLPQGIYMTVLDGPSFVLKMRLDHNYTMYIRCCREPSLEPNMSIFRRHTYLRRSVRCWRQMRCFRRHEHNTWMKRIWHLRGGAVLRFFMVVDILQQTVSSLLCREGTRRVFTNQGDIAFIKRNGAGRCSSCRVISKLHPSNNN